jgi:predicted ATPase
MPTKPGDRFGRYEIRAEIGSGAMGQVFHAHDSRLDRPVALKLIGDEREQHPEARARFEQEARSASSLNHPNIVTTNDIGEESGRLFIVMELLEGESLRRMLTGPLPVDIQLRVASQIAEALAAAHEHGIVHRDLKPENVFITRQGVAKILDFGLALIRRADHDAVSSSGTLQRVTTEGRVIGTAGYAAPEVLSGAVVDRRADIFSFGAILYEMACGAPAFRGATGIETLAATLRDEPTSPMNLRPDLPVSLCRLIMRCLHKDPKERYATLNDIRDELRIVAAISATSPASTRRRRPLPSARTELIGREIELARVVALFVEQRARLVTLTGPGGSGKTRLAIAAAGALQKHFKDDVFFVPLATITDPRQVPAAIAEALGVVSGPNQLPLAAVISELNVAATPTLLVLDNFEQIMGAANEVSELLAACPSLWVMITSREVLHLYGEHDIEVLPLALPDEEVELSVDELAKVPAIALFVSRASAVDPSFRFSADHAESVVELCRRLDGLPLAIELAAARVRMLPPRALLARLNQRLQILTSGARDLPDRQSTLRRTIDWSYGLLTPSEQTLFRRLGVFAGNITLEGAEAVADPFGRLGVEIVDSIASLVDKSLLHKHDAEDGEVAFAMLHTIREYANDLLSHSEDEETTRKAHAAYFLVLAEETAQVLGAGDNPEFLARLSRDHDNLRAALNWLVTTKNAAWAVRMGVALFRFWEETDHLSEGRRWLEAIMQLPGAQDDDRAYARLLFCTGVLASVQGDNNEAAARTEMSLAIYQRHHDDRGVAVTRNGLGLQLTELGELDRAASHLQASLVAWKSAGDESGYARSLTNLAFVRRQQGRPDEARKLYDEAAQVFVRIGDRLSGAWALNQQGDVARDQRLFDDADRFYRAALDVFHELDDQWGAASCTADLGTVARHRGEVDRAADFYRQALAIYSAIGHRRGVARILELMAVLAARLEAWERALTLSSAAARFRENIGVPGPVSEQAELVSAVEVASSKLAARAADEARRRGYAMTLPEAIRYAES